MIEQHMRRVVKPTGRISGEELADAYQKALPTDFTSRFPSFKRMYQDLSAAMHDAREDEVLVGLVLTDIEKHFDALRLFGK